MWQNLCSGVVILGAFMVRLFVLTFAFLGWAWYEMSGGSEFEPGENGIALLARVEVEDLPAAQPQTDVVAEAAPVAVPEVTRSTNSGVELAKVSAASFPQQTRVVTVVPHPGKVGAATNAVVKGETIAKPVVAASQPVVDVDYRTVTGNRVNLRAGPSTSYDVVTKLRRGDDVEVLQDPGTGWVKLRSFEGNDIGWMSADFLQVASN